jgi:hypothetical protein
MMKKTIFSMAAAALLAVPAFASAQSSVSGSAVVNTYMNLTGASSIVFGTLSRPVDASIDPAGGAGAATRSIDYNQNMTVTYTSVPTNLTATVNGSTANLPVSLKCAYKIGAAAWSAASACSGASFAMDVGGALTTGTHGFGGDILATDVANALAATYTGTMTVVLTAR